jgi:8-oxo-dGTP pyrophosphatase MutT (NUDIX family)
MSSHEPQQPILNEPGQALSENKPATPRQAATVILLRGRAQALEVLMVKRSEQARFMGGVWVFPGGSVDEHDGETAHREAAHRAVTDRAVTHRAAAHRETVHEAAPHRAAALRELREEAGIELAGPQALVEFSRWITPAEVAIRFDTRFFLAELPANQEPRVDGQECVQCGWFTPAAALAACERGEIQLVFPTIKHLERLGAFSSVAELLGHAAGRRVLPVQPRVVLDGEIARVVLPGEPGYD